MKSQMGFLLDMDGVVYRGNQMIPGADRFIDLLKKNQVPFLFLTNNSQRARRDIAMKLQRMGIAAESDDVFTCAMATARFLAQQRKRVAAYVIGENGLTSALHHNDIAVVDDDADYVVIGEGRTMNFEMVEKAVRLVEKGARLVATNLDATCPTDQGTRPGCGAIVAMIEKATGVKAFSVGKPSGVMMRMAQRQLGVRSEHTVMVGDTMYTDILGGVEMGFITCLVLSGHTKIEEVKRYAYQPDHIIESLVHMPDVLMETAGLGSKKCSIVVA
jgi:NagD protein